MSGTSAIEPVLEELTKLAPAGYFVGLHIRFASPLLTFQTYARRWQDHYTEQAYALRDPIIAWGFATEGVSRWSDIKIPDPFGILRQAAEYGLKYGVVVSCGPLRSRTIAGASRSDREFDPREMGRIEQLIREMHDLTEPPEKLTRAQTDALRLVAAGDRHAAAAAKLGISESALKARLTAARTRLMARTTAEALQRAKDYGLM